MKLYFLRHGAADWPDWQGNDDERPLTEAGLKEMRRVAKFLAKIGAAPQIIFSSPLPRAAQTAQIVHERLGGELLETALLAPGATARRVRALLKKHGDHDSFLFVGHEPDLSAIIRTLCGGRVKMAKAGLARVDLRVDPDETGQGREKLGQGRLIWLLPPKISGR